MKDRELKGILFDLDGVIVNTAKYHYLAWKRLADWLGIYFNEDINERLKGVSRMKSLDIILEKSDRSYTTKEKEKFCTLKNKWYVEMISKLTPLNILPGVIEVLTELKQYNIKTAICSASKNTTNIIRSLQIKGYFDVIVDGNHVRKPKPDPEVFLLGYEKLGIKSEECVVVEDAFAGIEAAKSIGIKTIGIGSKETLYNADIIYADMTYFTLESLANKLKLSLG